MTRALIAGIDVGVVGACALLTEAGELVAIEDMPILRAGASGRATIDPGLLTALLRRWRPSRRYLGDVRSACKRAKERTRAEPKRSGAFLSTPRCSPAPKTTAAPKPP